MADLSDLTWTKSRRSGNDGCVEIAFREDGQIAVRDSKDRGGPVLTFTRHEWDAFIGGVQDGDFNLRS